MRRGFSSAHIAEFFASIRNGHDLADLLGLQAAIFGDRRRPTAVPVPVDLDDADARRLRELGMADVVDGELRFADPEIAEIVGRSGEPLECVRTMLRAADAVADAVDDLAAAKVQALVGSMLARFGANFVPRPEEMGELNLVVADYRDLGRPRGGRPSARPRCSATSSTRLGQHRVRAGQRVGAGYAVAVTPWWWRGRRRTAARATPG